MNDHTHWITGDELIIGGVTLRSRLFTGTGKYSADSMIPEVLKAS